MQGTEKIINVLQVKAFLTIAAEGSVSAAADQMFRTQSAVTRSLRELENELHTSLFERHPGGMLLTTAGKAILPRVQAIFADISRAPALMARCTGRTSPEKGGEASWLLNSRRLQLLVALHQRHSVQQVANDFALSQPAVSAALKQLELGAATPLFERTAYGLRASLAGEQLVALASRVISGLRQIPDDLHSLSGSPQGLVRIGALPLSRSRLLPAAIVAVSRRYPGIRLATSESDFSHLHAALCAGQLDFIVGAMRDPDSWPDLDHQPLFSEELVLMVRKGHPLTGTSSVAGQLNGYQWLLPRPATPSRRLFNEAFSALGLPLPTATVETGDSTLVRGVLLQSAMIAVVSSHQLEDDVRAGLLVTLPLRLTPTRRQIGLIYRRGTIFSPAAAAVMAEITAWVDATYKK